jgi:Niemann-Pick C1 protein
MDHTVYTRICFTSIIIFYSNNYDYGCLAPYGGPVEPGVALGGLEGSDFSTATGLSVSFLVNNYHNKTLLEPAMEWELRYALGKWTC